MGHFYCETVSVVQTADTQVDCQQQSHDSIIVSCSKRSILLLSSVTLVLHFKQYLYQQKVSETSLDLLCLHVDHSCCSVLHEMYFKGF